MVVVRYEDCWYWDGAYNAKGYGRAWSERLSDTTAAHRMVYEELIEVIPPGLQLDHLCRIRSCVNPYHLRIMTGRENLLAPGSKALAALNVAKTHCPAGHQYDPANTYLTAQGQRQCKACKLVARRESARRTRSARVARPIREAGRSSGAEDAVSTGICSSAIHSSRPPEAMAHKTSRNE